MQDKRYRGNRHGLLASVPVLWLLGACDRTAPDAHAVAENSCHQRGYLQVDLHGGIQDSLAWPADRLVCEGMPRPDGRGARLRLAGPLGNSADATSIAFIIAIPDLQQGQADKEMPTNVTLIDEYNGRFFSTRDTSSCWTDVSRQEPLRTAGDADYDSAFSISGIVYCIAPLAELNGGSSISFTELTFTGQLDWAPAE